jgi:UDP-N-acetylglucosamine 2-epimerase (non-hydrolysing)
MKIDLIAGARPNFMKIAPITHAIQKNQGTGHPIEFRLIHTGQHYNKVMSDNFFNDLGIPKPDHNLGAGGGTQAEQTAAIMTGYEKLLMNEGKPDVCLVVGDVTSTMACSITAKKMQVKVAHVEAGIRSGDWQMPEEINRIVTDSITDYFFTTTETANQNLKNAGNPDKNVFLVGNTMIDTLFKQRPFFKKPPVWDELSLKDESYIIITLHRPANVDEQEKFNTMLNTIIDSAEGIPLVFPVHPRTAKIIRESGINFSTESELHLIDPLGYLEFNYLVEHSRAVITDSGGITEETTVMGIPCMTLRDNTERPETITVGTNELVGTNPEAIKPYMEKLLSGNWKKGNIPELWDGNAAKRIIETFEKMEN